MASPTFSLDLRLLPSSTCADCTQAGRLPATPAHHVAVVNFWHLPPLAGALAAMAAQPLLASVKLTAHAREPAATRAEDAGKPRLAAKQPSAEASAADDECLELPVYLCHSDSAPPHHLVLPAE